MYILSLDTTAKTAACAVCEFKEGRLSVLTQLAVNSTLTHSESLLPMVDFCLKNARIDFDSVELAAVSAGPGSFTGVRIGISALKGLAFGKDIKCVPVSTLHALSLNVGMYERGTIVCAVMDARRGQFYNALFETDGSGGVRRLCEDRAISASELSNALETCGVGKRIVLVGDGAYLAHELLKKEGFAFETEIAREDLVYQNAFSTARAALEIYDEKTASEGGYGAEKLLPTYLRLSQAERERNERLKANDNGLQ